MGVMSVTAMHISIWTYHLPSLLEEKVEGEGLPLGEGCILGGALCMEVRC